MVTLQRRPSGLFVPIPLLKHRKQTKTVTLPSGERAKVTVDDSKTVMQVEHGDVLDAIVRPKTIRYKVRSIG